MRLRTAPLLGFLVPLVLFQLPLMILSSSCSRKANDDSGRLLRPSGAGASSTPASETFTAEVIRVHDPGKRYMSWEFVLRRLDDGSPAAFEVRPRHPIIRALFPDLKTSPKVLYSREDARKRLPHLRLTARRALDAMASPSSPATRWELIDWKKAD